MNAPEKSDSPIVARKPTNEAAHAAEEQVERRGGTKENADRLTSISCPIIRSPVLPKWASGLAARFPH